MFVMVSVHPNFSNLGISLSLCDPAIHEILQFFHHNNSPPEQDKKGEAQPINDHASTVDVSTLHEAETCELRVDT
jgi:hypothetical protein